MTQAKTLWAFAPFSPANPRDQGRWHEITFGDALSAGSFGGTSEVMRIVTPGFTHLAAKLFNAATLPKRQRPEAYDKLAFISHMSQAFVRGYVGPKCTIPARPNIAWPELLLYSQRSLGPDHVVGFAMRAFTGMHPLTVLTTPRHRQRTFKACDTDTLFAVAVHLADLVDDVHGRTKGSGVLITDLTPRNVLIGTDLRLALIDADSFQFSTSTCVHVSNESTPGHRSPRIAKPALANESLPAFTAEDDAYALAILIFQILVDGAHPWRAGSQFEVSGRAPDEDENMLAGRFPYADPARMHPPRIRLQTYQKLPVEVRNAFEQTFCKSQPLPPAEWAKLLTLARVGIARPGPRPSHVKAQVARAA